MATRKRTVPIPRRKPKKPRLFQAYSRRRFRQVCELRRQGCTLAEIEEVTGISKRTLRRWRRDRPDWPTSFQVVGTRPMHTQFNARDRETAIWMVKGLGLTVEQIAWLFNRTERAIYLWMREFPNPRPPENQEDNSDE